MAGNWPWPDELDALIAAPKHHTLVFENERMRMLDTRIPPGDIVPVHTHKWPAVYYSVQAAPFIRRDQDGNITFDSRTAPGPFPPARWIENLPPHSVENVGDVEIHLVSVEMKE